MGARLGEGEGGDRGIHVEDAGAGRDGEKDTVTHGMGGRGGRDEQAGLEG